MAKQTFTGWVEHIFEPTQYDKQIVVRNYKDDDAKEAMKEDKKDFPTVLCFKANIKNGAANQLDDILEGDKVEITFMLSGMSGVSKKTGNYYCINSLMILKQNGVKILEKVAGERHETASIDDDDIPF